MLKRLVNECVLEVDLAIEGRLIVKEPDESTKAHKQAKGEEHEIVQPVTTRLPNGNETLYIPGSSLKGALRNQAERIAHTLNEHNAGACDPFAVKPRDGRSAPLNLACSERRAIQQASTENQINVAELYKTACPICRTFGYLGWGKRLRITDFYPPATDADRPGALVMTHIGVDRITGGVAEGRTFNVAYAYQGHVQGKIILENFELWQLGLLGFLWRDMADGLLPLGHKQTTGSGLVYPRLRRIRLAEISLNSPATEEIRGVGALFNEAAAYGYQPENDRYKLPGLTWTRASGTIRWEAKLDRKGAVDLWRALGERTANVLRDHQWPAQETSTQEKMP